MRLINTESFEQCEFTDKNIPKYAILSHTWGSEEITFQDYVWNIAKHDNELAGVKKIRYLCAQAKVDELKWAWIDTACIDKTSSAELSEALNSMMQWYTDAEICYAYLEDIDTEDRLETSRWFTRGWTLQELIAPMQVHFFGKEWKYIGSKSSLADYISKFTGIDSIVLRQEGAFRLYSVATRMSWASTRQTTRIEDMAYCLLGLFDINLPAVYGEGEKAFFRLQQEIIRNSDDETILAWNLNESSNSSGLASKPSAFKTGQDLIPLSPTEEHRPYILTNRGLQMYVRIQERLVTGGQGEVMAVLNCRYDRCYDGYVAIPLVQSRSSDTFYRKGTEAPSRLPLRVAQRLKWRTIYLVAASKITPVLGIKRSPCVLRFSPELSELGFYVQHEEPENAPGSWEPKYQTSEVKFSPRETDKVVVRNFVIRGEVGFKQLLVILVTGYLDPDARLYVYTLSDNQMFQQAIEDANLGKFNEAFRAQSSAITKFTLSDKFGHTHIMQLRFTREELLETKVRVIDISMSVLNER